MKKAIYVMALLAIPAFANAQGDDKAKSAKQAQIIAECIENTKEEATTDAAKAAFKDYCSCQAEAMVNNMTMAEIDEADNIESADEATKQKISAKVLPLLMPCMEELQKKMGGGQ